MTATYVKVQGLEDFRRTLRSMDRRFGIELREGLNDIAGIVVREAGPRYPRRTGKLAASVKARSTQREARVQVGTPARTPYAGWIDFGGVIRHRGAKHTHTAPHEIRRPVVQGGRYLYPAAAARKSDVNRRAEEVLERAARSAGLL